MTSLRRFRLDDLLRFNTVNLDVLTETYNPAFYLSYMAHWPDYFYLAEDCNNTPMGYFLGKAEGKGNDWHGHVTAVTVSPEHRRIGLSSTLMDLLEAVSQYIYDTYFVDLFVRKSNWVAQTMYLQLGYENFRTVSQYYSGEEDAWDMRKPLPRDVNKTSLICKKKVVKPEETVFD
eukprot:TRINITY_DN12358_c0_g1_i1.p1 TRINITY_DN12358_c0_g1~~TRINITY_DN12358_c0_g1_i1.p1  ORF type:complete len:175 (-),score=11.83 TRINITY_DN12358_c0_g1_i1:67-591(-)